MSVSLEPCIQDAVRRYCPVLYIHEKELYRPCSAEWFIERSELRFLPNGRQELSNFEVLVPQGKVTQQHLTEYMQTKAPNKLQLHISDEFQGGADIDVINDVPVYAHAKAINNAEGVCIAYEINYMTLYAYNGPYSVLGMPFVKKGEHPGGDLTAQGSVGAEARI